MKNREAIEWLKGCVVSYEVDNKGKPNGNITCDLTQEVLDMAISALEKQEADMWIPVTERLPEIHKDVLVRDREVSDVYVSYYCGDGYWNTDTGGANNRIIAWRPLPEAYEAEEES